MKQHITTKQLIQSVKRIVEDKEGEAKQEEEVFKWRLKEAMGGAKCVKISL